jgi:hypothetical protein
MVKAGRASIKRGKPSYFMSILGVTLVLFLMGIIGLITINGRKIIQALRKFGSTGVPETKYKRHGRETLAKLYCLTTVRERNKIH